MRGREREEEASLLKGKETYMATTGRMTGWGRGAEHDPSEKFPNKEIYLTFILGWRWGARKSTSCDLVWDSLHDKEDGGARMGP